MPAVTALGAVPGGVAEAPAAGGFEVGYVTEDGAEHRVLLSLTTMERKGQGMLRLHPAAAEAVIVSGNTLTRWMLAPKPQPVARTRTEVPLGLIEVVPGPEAEAPLVVGTRDDGGLDEPQQLELRRWDDGWLVDVITVPGSGVGVTGLACSPDGAMLAVADFYEEVRLLDRSTKRVTSTLRAGEATSGLRFSPDGRWLTAICTCQGGGWIPLWAVRQGKLTRTRHELDSQGLVPSWGPLADTFGATAFSPVGDVVVVSTSSDWATPSWVRGLTCYGLPDGQRRWHRTIGPDLVTPPAADEVWWSDLVVTPDGRWVVCGTQDGELLAFATATGDLVGRLRVHAGPVASFQISSDPEPTLWVQADDHPVAVRLSHLQA